MSTTYSEWTTVAEARAELERTLRLCRGRPAPIDDYMAALEDWAPMDIAEAAVRHRQQSEWVPSVRDLVDIRTSIRRERAVAPVDVSEQPRDLTPASRDAITQMIRGLRERIRR